MCDSHAFKPDRQGCFFRIVFLVRSYLLKVLCCGVRDQDTIVQSLYELAKI